PSLRGCHTRTKSSKSPSAAVGSFCSPASRNEAPSLWRCPIKEKAPSASGNCRRAGRAVGPFLKHGQTNQAFEVFLEGERLCTGDARGTLRIWNFVSGELIREVTGAHQGAIYDHVRIPNRRLSATASYDQTVCLWNTDTLEAVGKPMRHLGRLIEVRSSPDGKYLTARSPVSGVVLVWDVETQTEVRRWETPQSIHGVIFDPRG